MARWIILLRGVNVSGKNKVPMAEWKAGLAALGYTNIVTLQNSGNAVLDTNSDRAALIHEVTGLMRERFGLEIPVYAIEQESLRELLAQSPAWWGHEDKAIYDNLIFLLPPHTAEELEEALGAPHPELEWVHPCGDAVFWSFDRQKYQKTNWWPRTAQEPAREWITIRTAGTVRKLAVLYWRFPIKMTPAGRNLRGCYFCGGFFLFCNAAGRFRRKGAQPPQESHRYIILPAATQSFPSFLQT